MMADTFKQLSKLIVKLGPGAVHPMVQKIASLSGLQELQITEAATMGAAELSNLANLTDLKKLHVDNCQLDPAALSTLSSISSLRHLSVWASSRVSNASVALLTTLQQLTSLEMACTQQQPSLAAIAALTNLRRLKYSDMTGQAGARTLRQPCLSDLQRLSSLSVPNLVLVGAAAQAVLRLPELNHLDCQSYYILGSINDLANCAVQHLQVDMMPTAHHSPTTPWLPASILTLQARQLHWCQRCEGVVAFHSMKLAMRTMTRLKLDDISTLEKPGPAFADFMGLMTSLQELSLGNSSMCDVSFSAIALAPSVRSLTIQSFPNITDAGIATLAGWRHLRSATFRGCSKLTRASAVTLAMLPETRAVALVGCGGVSQQDMEWVGMVVRRVRGDGVQLRAAEVVDEEEEGQ